eukprot:6563534-Prymnesium_polylepis.2
MQPLYGTQVIGRGFVRNANADRNTCYMSCSCNVIERSGDRSAPVSAACMSSQCAVVETWDLGRGSMPMSPRPPVLSLALRPSIAVRNKLRCVRSPDHRCDDPQPSASLRGGLCAQEPLP